VEEFFHGLFPTENNCKNGWKVTIIQSAKKKFALVEKL